MRCEELGDRSWKQEAGSKKLGARSWKLGGRSWKSEVGSRKSEGMWTEDDSEQRIAEAACRRVCEP
ncbi:MAG: hypothetical protein D6721_07330 [Gammaproteobacteria bacterium]|nr:MAG: hypothetical protein D6721_07330 [Gammaproteobacteria bacterium]